MRHGDVTTGKKRSERYIGTIDVWIIIDSYSLCEAVNLGISRWKTRVTRHETELNTALPTSVYGGRYGAECNIFGNINDAGTANIILATLGKISMVVVYISFYKGYFNIIGYIAYR